MGRPTPLLLLGVVAALAAVLALGAAPARAADVTLRAGQCFFAGGGQISEPAESTITIYFADDEVNLGMLEDYLLIQTTTLTLNGGAPVDVSSLYGSPTQDPNGAWRSAWTYPTGITLAHAGDTMTFSITVTLSRLFAEETNGPVGFSLGFLPGPPIFTPTGVYFTDTCTVTAV